MPGAYKTLTAKQEAFVRAYMELGNATEAYHRVYNGAGTHSRASCSRVAADLLDNPKVQAKLEELKQNRAAEANKRTSRDTQWYITELERAAELALAKGDPTAFERVRMSQAKLEGLLVDKVEQRVGQLDPEEAKPDIASIWSRAGQKPDDSDGDKPTIQ